MSSLGRAVGSVQNAPNLQNTWTEDCHVWTNCECRFARMTQYSFGGGAENEAIDRTTTMGSHYDQRGASTLSQDGDRLARVSFQQDKFCGSPPGRKRLGRQQQVMVQINSLLAGSWLPGLYFQGSLGQDESMRDHQVRDKVS